MSSGAEVELKTGDLANDVIPVQQRGQSAVDVNAIRDYLEGRGTSDEGRVAQGDKRK